VGYLNQTSSLICHTINGDDAIKTNSNSAEDRAWFFSKAGSAQLSFSICNQGSSNALALSASDFRAVEVE
jgi:hypothetical protein